MASYINEFLFGFYPYLCMVVYFLGSWVLPLTAYSDVLHNFDGGIGQIALHGRGGASLLQPVGAAASHGCVRIENTQINRIAALVPTGTPVVII